MTVFVDTSAIFAVLDHSERNHELARARLAHLVSRAASLVSSNYIVLEACALLQRRMGPGKVKALRDDVLPALSIHWVSPAQHETAFATLLASGRRKLSLVDCASFAVMRDLGIETAFAFDRHFDEEGFDTNIPAPRPH